MSEASSERHTPRSTASHGRIVTENSALLALLREKSTGDSVAPCNASVNSHVALDVVPSDVAATNTNKNNQKVEYISVRKSRLSLNTNDEPLLADNTRTVDSANSAQRDLHDNQSVSQRNQPDIEQDLTHNQPESKVKSQENFSYPNTSTELYDSDSNPNTPSAVSGNLSESNLFAESDANKQKSNVCTSTSGHVVNQPGRQYSANINKEPVSLLEKNTSDSQQENSQGERYGYQSLKSTGYSLRTKPGTEYNNNAHDGGDHIAEKRRPQASNTTEVNDLGPHAIHTTVSHHPEEVVEAPAPYNTVYQKGNNTEHQHENNIVAHQHTRLSLDSQHDRVARTRDIETISITQVDQGVPPLDLTQFAASRQSVVSDSDSCLSSPTPTAQEPLYGQNLHVSDQQTPLVYFSPHDIYSTGRKTYEVENPVYQSQLPHVKSSDNFRGEEENYQQDDQSPTLDQDSYRDRELGPNTTEQVDLADQLKVPYPFDTSAQNSPPPRYDKPPSPPVQTTPPPVTDPATSLKSRSNSSVYAVANPNILRAQGISPPPDVQFTPRQYSNAQPKLPEIGERSQVPKSRQSEVRFSADTGHISPREHYGSPVGERPPTPYASSPDRDRRRSATGDYPPIPPDWDNGEERPVRQRSTASQRRGDGLPPQHPPIDTKHSSKPPSAAKSQREDSNSIKRVYVESPSFSKEEEDRYRFVSSRLDDMEAHEQDTVRQMDTAEKQGYGSDDMYAGNRHTDKPRRGDNRQYDQDRYEDRNREMNGYADDKRKDERYRFDKENDPFERQERYDRLQDEREEQLREPVREPDPEPRQEYRKQNTEIEEFELQREQEYQQDLQRRMSTEKRKDDKMRIPTMQQEQEGYDENYARDSLEFQPDRDRDRPGYARDSLDYDGYQQYGDGYNQQNREWGNAPQQPYDQEKYYQNGFAKQSSKPDFYDAEDVRKMEIVHPTQPKYDYVIGNKEDYGLPPRKSYRDIIHKKKEEEDKLDHVFITPKVPTKPKKKGSHKKTHSAQPEHLGYQPPMRDPFQFNSKPSSAEELWAKRSAVLSKKESLGSGSSKGKTGPKGGNKWSSNVRINPQYKPEPPPNLPSQAYKPVGYHANQQSYNNNQSGYGSQGYTTPTRLQPLDNKPNAPPPTDEIAPTAVDPSSPFRRHRELKPITQEITTEDGQRISVDINLRLISPPPLPGQGGPGSPRQQLALVPVQESQGAGQSEDTRTVGVPYQMQDQYGSYQDGYTATYQEEQDGYTAGNTEPITMETKYTDVSPQDASEGMADGSGYAKKYVPGQLRFDDDDEYSTDTKMVAGYAAIYNKMKSKDPKDHPWYKTHTIADYQKLLREIRLNRGSLGPDLDTESYKEKMEKRHKQFEYARMVMEKNRIELGHKKPATFPRSPPKSDTSIKRKAQKKMALDYAKSVPKPTVKARPNQYNSYEVSAQVAPGGGNTFRRSPPGKNMASPHSMDVIDVRTLEQRHLQERKNVDKIKHGMESVLSQKV